MQLVLDYYLRSYNSNHDHYAIGTYKIDYYDYYKLIRQHYKNGYLKISEFHIKNPHNDRCAVIMDKYLYNCRVHYIYYHHTNTFIEIGVYNKITDRV